jgi:hypothetical protein
MLKKRLCASIAIATLNTTHSLLEQTGRAWKLVTNATRPIRAPRPATNATPSTWFILEKENLLDLLGIQPPGKAGLDSLLNLQSPFLLLSFKEIKFKNYP